MLKKNKKLYSRSKKKQNKKYNKIKSKKVSRLKRKVKKSRVVESPDKGVTVLTDANFNNKTDDKNTMLEFYAPWCGHCQAFKSTYTDLGSRFANTDIVIGAMDATTNTPPKDYDVRGYPTLIFKTAEGTRMSYNGNRDVDSMAEYINEHTKK